MDNESKKRSKKRLRMDNESKKRSKKRLRMDNESKKRSRLVDQFQTQQEQDGIISGGLNTDFCMQVANNVLLKQAEKGSNFAISPLSLHVILTLVAKGSVGNTLNQLLELLKADGIDNLDLQASKLVALAEQGQNLGGPLLSSVNGAWIKDPLCFKPSFEAIVNGVYKAVTKKVDFKNKANQVIDEVNSWAENATKGLIKQLLPPKSLGPKTILVLANALYFKGAWDRKFDASKTKNRGFQLLNGKVVQVPFMKKTGSYGYSSCDDYQLLGIPYECGEDHRRFSMYFLLPHEKDGLPNLIQKVISNPRLLNQKFRPKTVHCLIPKFKFSFEFEASEAMKELGLVLPFMPGELTEMIDSSKNGTIALSKIFHKAYIEVNEEGTEAAAATAAVFRMMCCSSRPPPPPEFVADHPFLFMIREEESGVVFFTGAVLNPLLDS